MTGDNPRAILAAIEAGARLRYCDLCEEATTDRWCCGATTDRLDAASLRDALAEDEEREIRLAFS